MANLLFAGDVRIEVDEDKLEEVKYALVIQCDGAEELRQAIANRAMIDFAIFGSRPTKRAPDAGDSADLQAVSTPQPNPAPKHKRKPTQRR